jgi:hypothetical protein
MPNERKILRCAIHTRKSSEHGLEQDFNSLEAQREAAEAYIKSQAHEGCFVPLRACAKSSFRGRLGLCWKLCRTCLIRMREGS